MIHKYNCQDSILEVIVDFDQLFVQCLPWVGSWSEALMKPAAHSRNQQPRKEWPSGHIWASTGCVSNEFVGTQCAVFACCCYDGSGTVSQHRLRAPQSQKSWLSLACSGKGCSAFGIMTWMEVYAELYGFSLRLAMPQSQVFAILLVFIVR